MGGDRPGGGDGWRAVRGPGGGQASSGWGSFDEGELQQGGGEVAAAAAGARVAEDEDNSEEEEGDDTRKKGEEVARG